MDAGGGMVEKCSARPLFEALIGLGMSHLVGIPDNGTATLFALARAHERVALLTVTREGEASAVASGLWLGGKSPVVVVQNTGLLESGDSLRGTAYRMGVPLPILVGVRGHAKLVSHYRDIEAARAAGQAPQTMKRAEVDSVALVTEPTLQAWNVPYVSYRSHADVGEVTRLCRLARDVGHPVAVLLPFSLEPDESLEMHESHESLEPRESHPSLESGDER
jgi:sulfopyruvate decarboxylase TPP-binding subunit